MERHPFDPLSFGFGAFFLVCGLLLLTGSADALPLEWVGPLIAIALGTLIVFAARPARAKDETVTDADAADGMIEQ